MHPYAKHVVTSISFLFLSSSIPAFSCIQGSWGFARAYPCCILIFQFLKIFNVWITYIIFVMKNSHTVTSCGLVLAGGPGRTLWWRHGQRGGFSRWIAKTERRGIFGGVWVQARWSLTSLSSFLFVNSVYPAPTFPYWWLDPLQVLHSCHRRESCLDQYNPVKQQVCCVSRMLLQWKSFTCNFSLLFFPRHNNIYWNLQHRSAESHFYEKWGRGSKLIHLVSLRVVGLRRQLFGRLPWALGFIRGTMWWAMVVVWKRGSRSRKRTSAFAWSRVLKLRNVCMAQLCLLRRWNGPAGRDQQRES